MSDGATGWPVFDDGVDIAIGNMRAMKQQRAMP
jgi:hypothetical protein